MQNNDVKDLQATVQQRRRFFKVAGTGVASVIGPSLGLAQGAGGGGAGKIEFPPTQVPSQTPEKMQPPPDPPGQRIGFAVVGLGRLSVGEILPAFAQCKHARVVALVSGDRDKAAKLARQYGIRDQALYSYENFDRIADNPEVQVVYIVLPNGMHADFTIRAARAGKHVLCEKPMANSVAECSAMIDACRKADRKLMIAYRSQYEPMDREIVRMVRDKRLGTLTEFISTNSQNMSDPDHWRLKRKLAGGGPLPDVGIYCINGVRFLSGEEPNEVVAVVRNNPADPRFREVEESVQFTLRFPSGLAATCSSSYNTHKSQYLRLQGTTGWVELNPAYAYHGNRLRYAHLQGEHEVVEEVQMKDADQFARELDHMAQCVQKNTEPHTPGEEGLQDQRIIEAIYQSAKTGKPVTLASPGKTRGPEPEDGV